MEIWIRSQDGKTLVSEKEIYVTRRSKCWCICTGRGFDLGAYSAEEKAIKVLDMICEKIKITEFNEIFQMPQDEKVMKI